MPNDITSYQNTTVIALQSGFTIEGRDVPTKNHPSGQATVTHFTHPHHPDQIITWQLNNTSFPREDSVGTVSCYICGGGHYTSEHAICQCPHQQPTR
jgi:hypothetical protein